MGCLKKAQWSFSIVNTPRSRWPMTFDLICTLREHHKFSHSTRLNSGLYFFCNNFSKYNYGIYIIFIYLFIILNFFNKKIPYYSAQELWRKTVEMHVRRQWSTIREETGSFNPTKPISKTSRESSWVMSGLTDWLTWLTSWNYFFRNKIKLMIIN